MIQSGTLYTVDSSSGTPTNVPIKGARLMFMQGSVIRHQTVTNATTGAYSLGVAVGKYTVELAVGSTTVVLRAGQEFELKSTDNASAFQNWLYSKSGDINDQLLKSFKDIMNETMKAKDDTIIAKNEIVNNSVGNSSGKWMKEGAYGIKEGISLSQGANLNDLTSNGSYRWEAFTPANVPPGSTGFGFVNVHAWKNGEGAWQIGAFSAGKGNLFYRWKNNSRSSWLGWYEFYNTGNTTVDSNGFIKKASPIVKLFDDHIETSGFKEQPVFEKLSAGTYKISNTLGLAREGWTFEKPRGGDGNPYFRIKVEKTDDGCIISIHDEYDIIEPVTFTNEKGEEQTANRVVKVLSKARDIKEHERWIDLRFHEEPEIIEETENI